MDKAVLPVEILSSTPSTMDAARERVIGGRFAVGPGPVTCACVMAREQTAGRGQRGRAWFAERDQSLCATYMLHCPGVTEPSSAGRIALIAGVAVAEVLLHCEVRGVLGLKWPNDVMLNSKKLGGILVEMMKSPGGTWTALIGIGLNVSVRQFPPDLASTATSLLMEGVDIDTLPNLQQLARDIGDSLSSWAYQCLPDYQALIDMWRHFDATTGRRYETEWNGAVVIGMAEGINEEGALLLRLNSGLPVAVTSASTLREILG